MQRTIPPYVHIDRILLSYYYYWTSKKKLCSFARLALLPSEAYYAPREVEAFNDCELVKGRECDCFFLFGVVTHWSQIFVAEKKSVKWYFRIASVHGPKMALPFIKSIEVTLKFYCRFDGSQFCRACLLLDLSVTDNNRAIITLQY